MLITVCPACKASVSYPDGTQPGPQSCPRCKAALVLGAPEAPAPGPYLYRVVRVPPEVVTSASEDPGRDAAGHLERLVNRYASAGWEYLRLDSVGIKVRPGCLAALFGARETLVMVYTLTFRRPMPHSPQAGAPSTPPAAPP